METQSLFIMLIGSCLENALLQILKKMPVMEYQIKTWMYKFSLSFAVVPFFDLSISVTRKLLQYQRLLLWNGPWRNKGTFK